MSKTITLEEWMEHPNTWENELDGYSGEELVKAGWYKAMKNNPFCQACQEEHCCIGGDDKCEMIRVYEKLKPKSCDTCEDKGDTYGSCWYCCPVCHDDHNPKTSKEVKQ